jgi:hypothetical protein
MALPATIDVNSLLGSSSPALIDNDIASFKQAVLDIFGLTSGTPVTTALLTGSASGLTAIILLDAASNPAAAGEIKRNSRRLMYYDGGTAIPIGGTIAMTDNAGVEIGNVGGSEDTLRSFTLAANTLNATNRMLRVTAWGRFGSTGVHTKTLKFKFGTASATLNPTTTQPNGNRWHAQIDVIRISASVQRIYHRVTLSTIGHESLNETASTQDETTATTVSITGESASSITDSVLCSMLYAEIIN